MQNHQKKETISKRSSQTDWKNDSYHASNFQSPTEVPELAETGDPDPVQVSILREHGQYGPGIPDGTGLVYHINAIPE